MFDKVFGEVTFDCGYDAKKNICFGEENIETTVHIDCDEGEEITQTQRDAYEALMQNWGEMQHKIAAAILKYYNEEEKGAYGPDDADEFAMWWPDINNEAEMMKKIHLNSVVIPSDYIIESRGENPVYVLFDRDWGGEDLEDNGVAVFIKSGEISEVGYKYIAF